MLSMSISRVISSNPPARRWHVGKTGNDGRGYAAVQVGSQQMWPVTSCSSRAVLQWRFTVAALGGIGGKPSSEKPSRAGPARVCGDYPCKTTRGRFWTGTGGSPGCTGMGGATGQLPGTSGSARPRWGGSCGPCSRVLGYFIILNQSLPRWDSGGDGGEIGWNDGNLNNRVAVCSNEIISQWPELEEIYPLSYPHIVPVIRNHRPQDRRQTWITPGAVWITGPCPGKKRSSARPGAGRRNGCVGRSWTVGTGGRGVRRRSRRGRLALLGLLMQFVGSTDAI